MLMAKLTAMLIMFLDFIQTQFTFDMGIMGQPWMYWPMLVPITIYAAFFIVKWTFIFAPIGLLMSAIFKGNSGVNLISKLFVLPIMTRVNKNR